MELLKQWFTQFADSQNLSIDFNIDTRIEQLQNEDVFVINEDDGKFGIMLGSPVLHGTHKVTLPPHALIFHVHNPTLLLIEPIMENKIVSFWNKWRESKEKPTLIDMHPHISNGSPCLGNFNSSVRLAQRNLDILAIVNILRAFINNWTRDDCYWNINRYVSNWKRLIENYNYDISLEEFILLTRIQTMLLSEETISREIVHLHSDLTDAETFFLEILNIKYWEIGNDTSNRDFIRMIKYFGRLNIFIEKLSSNNPFLDDALVSKENVMQKVLYGHSYNMLTINQNVLSFNTGFLKTTLDNIRMELTNNARGDSDIKTLINDYLSNEPSKRYAYLTMEQFLVAIGQVFCIMNRSRLSNLNYFFNLINDLGFSKWDLKESLTVFIENQSYEEIGKEITHKLIQFIDRLCQLNDNEIQLLYLKLAELATEQIEHDINQHKDRNEQQKTSIKEERDKRETITTNHSREEYPEERLSIGQVSESGVEWTSMVLYT